MAKTAKTLTAGDTFEVPTGGLISVKDILSDPPKWITGGAGKYLVQMTCGAYAIVQQLQTGRRFEIHPVRAG